LDCIIYSHVPEHVFDPQDMLIRLAETLKPGGTVLLSLPKAACLLRHHFGNDWRAPEAPRRLSSPLMRRLEANLREIGLRIRQRQFTRLRAAAESSRIRRRGTRLNSHNRAVAKGLTAGNVFSSYLQYDVVEIVCVKDTRRAL
jgi:2-polyprenyl-3-methyl-5-hydroxy-6-metoxy-1,4-benzoquinol methylase